LLGLEAADLGDRVVGRADDERAAFHLILDRSGLCGVTARDATDVAEIVLPLLEAELHVVKSFLAGLGDVDRTNETQLLWVHLAAVLGGDVVGDLPVDAKGVVAAFLRGGHAEHAKAVLAGELAARRRDR